MTDFQRENRYIVIKLKDMAELDNEGLLPPEQQDSPLDALQLALPKRECVIVESDWPEYELVWQMIEARTTSGDNHIAISRHSKRLVEQLCTQIAERDKMLEEFATELTLVITDHQVRSAMTQVGRTKCMELLQKYNQR